MHQKETRTPRGYHQLKALESRCPEGCHHLNPMRGSPRAHHSRMLALLACLPFSAHAPTETDRHTPQVLASGQHKSQGRHAARCFVGCHCSFGCSVNLPLGSRSADPYSTAVDVETCSTPVLNCIWQGVCFETQVRSVTRGKTRGRPFGQGVGAYMPPCLTLRAASLIIASAFGVHAKHTPIAPHSVEYSLLQPRSAPEETRSQAHAQQPSQFLQCPSYSVALCKVGCGTVTTPPVDSK